MPGRTVLGIVLSGIVLFSVALTACSGAVPDGGLAAPTTVASPEDVGACPEPAAAADPEAVPADFPAVEGLAFTRIQKQGKTLYFTGQLPGDGVVAGRDAVSDALRAAGWTLGSGDAEGNVEADNEFTGPHEGTIRVVRLCNGRLELRVKYTS